MHAIHIWSNIGNECSMFLILILFFKKNSHHVNAAIMTLNAVMRKNSYFSFKKIHTHHDIFIKVQ
jgi:hypothetical protein